MNTPIKVLVVAETEGDTIPLARQLDLAGIPATLRQAGTRERMKAELAGNSWDLIAAEYTLSRFGAPEALALLKEGGLDIPLIVLCAQADAPKAADLVLAGALDYVVKDDLGRLAPLVARERREARERRARMLAERQLKESEDRYRRFMKMSAEGIYRFDCPTPIPTNLEERLQAETILNSAPIGECNDAFALHYGYSQASEMTGRRLSEIWIGGAEEQIGPLIRFVLSGYRLFDFETSEQDREGRRLSFLNNLLGIVEQGRLVCAWGTHRDITERKRAELALTREKRFSDEIINSLPGVFFMYNDEFRLVRWNKRHEEITGCPAAEMLLKQPLHFFDDNEKERVTEAFMRAAEEGHSEIEAGLRNRQGRVTPYYLNVVRLNLGDKVFYLGTGIDISERVKAQETRLRLEAQLRHAQKLEAVGTLAGGIAHDFNNILGAIVSFTELARAESGEQAKIQELLDQALQSCSRAKDLIHQILTFSRQSQHERVPILLQPVVKEALKLLRSTLPATIEITQDIAPNAPLVLADATQIHQIAINLCTNAAQAIQGKVGRLSVGLAPFEASADFVLSHVDMRVGLYAELTVSDTGRGMDDSTLRRVFEPFFTTKGQEGVGLGLSVVHGIVKEHDGAIYVYSRQNEGTVFKLYFPAVPGGEAAAAAAHTRLFQGQGQRILFVDDEAALGRAAELMLKRLGCVPSVKMNPREALTLFQSSPQDFDLVVTDLTMPDMTGADLAGNILSIRPDIPILLTSGFDGTWTPEKVRAAGMKKLVMKPINLAALSDALREVFPAKDKQSA